ncbi:MAG: serine protease [Candidatus Korobacteraceae bacterium]|jgi:S1-C subfamily serine protease
MKRLILWVMLSSSVIMAQVAPPRHESGLHRIFSSQHDEGGDLQQRYENLKCALVLLKSPTRAGSGFYISSDGDILTASHVLGERIYSLNPNHTIQVSITNLPDKITVESGKDKFDLHKQDIEINGDDWLVDLAVLHSGKPTSCWLAAADTSKVVPGQHVISIGFPGLAFLSMSLYTGIVSARLKNDQAMGQTVDGTLLPYINEFFRVQIPASPGLSGAPVIDDQNHVIGVITSGGMWSQDLELLTQFERNREMTPPPAPPPPPNQRNVDWIAATGQLARFFHDWASPGYGDAVPLSYLKRGPVPTNQPPDKSVH